MGRPRTTTSSRIERLAEAAGKTGAQLARDINMTRTTWYRRMKEDDWTVSELRLIAAALDVAPAVLLLGHPIGEEAA